MALIKCPECGREKVSDSADMCPGCGYGIKAHYDKIKQEEEERLAEEREILRFIEEERKQPEEDCEKQYQENMNKNFGSPIVKKMAWILVVIFVFIIIIAIFISNDAKKCSFGSCNNLKMEGSKYCVDHTCKEKDCYSSKSEYDSYCRIHEEKHICAYSGCENYKVSGGEYCYSHTCSKTGCYNEKGYGSDYCTDHQVDMRKRLTDSSFFFLINSAGGIEFTFSAKNSTGKEIKYVRFDVELRNAVGDLVKDEIKRKATVSVEIVGPVKAGGKVSMSSKIIGYCDTCARIDINDITIIYTDGTSETGYFGYYSKK